MHWFNLTYSPFYEFHIIRTEVLIILVISALIMWLLIIERYLYFVFNNKHIQAQYLQQWQITRSEVIDERRLLKSYYLSEYRSQSERGIGWIQLFTRISLLLGLLGTVLALIAVFEMQLLATSDLNLQISGSIALAIIPTTAGLLVSLSGLLFASHLRSLADNSISRLDSLFT